MLRLNEQFGLMLSWLLVPSVHDTNGELSKLFLEAVSKLGDESAGVLFLTSYEDLEQLVCQEHVDPAEIQSALDFFSFRRIKSTVYLMHIDLVTKLYRSLHHFAARNCQLCLRKKRFLCELSRLSICCLFVVHNETGLVSWQSFRPITGHCTGDANTGIP